MDTIPFALVYQGMLLKGYANPVKTLQDAIPSSMLVYVQGWCIGTLSYANDKWSMDQPIDPEFVASLGNQLHSNLKLIQTAMHSH